MKYAKLSTQLASLNYTLKNILCTKLSKTFFVAQDFAICFFDGVGAAPFLQPVGRVTKYSVLHQR
jgi:hypothetical protein